VIWLFLAMLVLFFVTGTTISAMSRKLMRRGFEELVVGGYRVGGFLSAMTYAATTYSAFMMVGLVGLAYARGVAALGFELVYLAATVGIVSLVGPTIWARARERRWVTPSEMLGDVYGSKAFAAAVSILYLVALVPYLGAQLKGVGELLNAVGLGYELGVVFASAVTFLWIAIAGLWSVATTDAFQGIWMLATSMAALIWATAYLAPSAGLDLAKAIDVLTRSQQGNLLGFAWPASMFIGMSVPWIFFALTNPQVVQRLFIPRDARAFKRMVKYFALYGFVYTLLCVFLGLLFRAYAAVALPEQELSLVRARDSVTPTILLKGPPILAAATFVGIVAAAISTADSIVLTVASSITRDLYMSYSKSSRENRVELVTYASIALMVLIASIVALHRIAYVVELSVTSSAILLPLAPITLAGICIEPKRRGLPYAATSLALGLLVAILAVVVLGPGPALTQPLLGLPMPLWVLAISSIPVAALAVKEKGRGGNTYGR